MIYEANKASSRNGTRSLKTCVLPNLIKPGRTARQNEMAIAVKVIVVRESTLLNFAQYGRPRSRAKDHIIHEEAVKDPITAQNGSTATSVSMTIAAVIDHIA